MERLLAYDSSDDGSLSDTELPPTTKKQKLFHKQDMSTPELVRNPQSQAQSKYTSHGVEKEVVAGAYVSKRKARNVSTSDPATKQPTYFKSPNLDAYLSSQNRGVACEGGNRVCKSISLKWEGHSKPVESLDWHPLQSNLLLSSGFDGLCKIWDVSRSVNHCCILSHTPHSGQAVSTVKWLSNSAALSCGYDCRAVITDFIAMKQSARFVHSSHVTALRPHPSDDNLFISGDASKNVQLWDIRTEKPVSNYLGAGGQILDVEFISEGSEIVASCDIVRKNAGSKMLLVWETDSTIVKSHQIYDEPFTCPCLRATDKAFLAQSNAGYIIIFSAKKPYKISKYNRFEGHEVGGYRTQFTVSPDGSLLCSCSADGCLYFFHYYSTKVIRTVRIGPSPTIAIAWHPFLSTRLACSSWDGAITVLE